MNYYKNVNDLFLEGEIWKDIEGYNGDYQVSNYGRIKSFKKYRGTDENILSQIKNNTGYLRIKLYKNGEGEPKLIHDLLFETFNNYKLKEDEVIHHINENKLDNTFDNLQKMADFEHKSFHNSGKNNPNYGKKCPEISKRMSGKNNPMYGKTGENNPGSILTEQKVIKIRELDLPQKELVKMYGVSQPTISDIKNRKIWKHI